MIWVWMRAGRWISGTREVIPLLGRFRPGILTVNEDVTRAGNFLAHAILQAIETPDAPPMQGLEVPDTVNVFL